MQYMVGFTYVLCRTHSLVELHVYYNTVLSTYTATVEFLAPHLHQVVVMAGFSSNWETVVLYCYIQYLLARLFFLTCTSGMYYNITSCQLIPV